MPKGNAPSRKGKPNIVLSSECLAWARHNGHAAEAAGAEKLRDAYRQWQVDNGKVSNLLYLPVEVLDERIAKALAQIDRYQQVKQLKHYEDQ
jgi:hypothetical protein